VIGVELDALVVHLLTIAVGFASLAHYGIQPPPPPTEIGHSALQLLTHA
jgi:hypothetical protein